MRRIASSANAIKRRLLLSRRGARLPLSLFSTTLLGVLALSACTDDDNSNGDGDGDATGGRNGDGDGDATGGLNGDGDGDASGGRIGDGDGDVSGGRNGDGDGDAAGGFGGEGLGGSPSDMPCDNDDGGLDLPNGFCAVLAAENLGRARHLTVTPSGDVFVAVNPSPDGSVPGSIIALRDTNDNGKLDVRARFNSEGGNGIVWRDGELFVAENDRIVKYAIPDGELVPTALPEVIVSGLPADGDHRSKTIAFFDDRTMFVNIGSATNSCQMNNRQLESLGQDPCLELEERGGVWVFDPTILGQTPADGERYATGTRNANALAIQPGSEALWAVTNGRDQLYENWPDLYAPEVDMRLPSESLLRLEDGGDYGWPYCYHDPAIGMVRAPEYGGDGEVVGACDLYSEPDFAFPGHWAPLGAVFYDADQFPTHYQGGLFVAFHGSRFEPNATGALPGYQVGFLPFDGNDVGDDFETFASGFAGASRPLPDEAESRPVGVAVAPDGSLYVTDDQGGKLWRVYYAGN